MVAVKGRTPVGYYKDQAKSDATFKTIDGARYSIPGDFATVAADGTLELLGRGSVCINTGGEKVFPEEVEEALKTASGVRDAVAVGVPDEKFGQAIVAMVELAPDADSTRARVIAHVKTKLACVQGAQARAAGAHHRPRRERQGRLQAFDRRGRNARLNRRLGLADRNVDTAGELRAVGVERGRQATEVALPVEVEGATCGPPPAPAPVMISLTPSPLMSPTATWTPPGKPAP